MGIFKNLFGTKAEKSELQNDFDRHFPDVIKALLIVKMETGLDWTIVLPNAKRVAGLVILKSLGPTGASQLYDKWLNELEKRNGVPASAIREFKVPKERQEDKDLVVGMLVDLMEARIKEGNNPLPVAMALDNCADFIANDKVAGWYSTALANQIRQEAKSGEFDL